MSPVHSGNPFGCDRLALTKGGTWVQDGLPRSVSSTGHKVKQELWDLKKPLDFPPYPWNLTTHPSDSEKHRAVYRWWRLSEVSREQNGIDFNTEAEDHDLLKAKVFCFKYIYIYSLFLLHWVFVAEHGLFSSCREQRLLLISVLRPLTVLASPVAEHSL